MITISAAVVIIVWFVKDIRRENSKVFKAILDTQQRALEIQRTALEIQRDALEIQRDEAQILAKIEDGQRKGFEKLAEIQVRGFETLAQLLVKAG